MTMKRILSILLAMALLITWIPAISAAEPHGAEVLTEEAYVDADAVFAEIDRLETVRATKNQDQSRLTDAVAELVMASDSYVKNSLVRNGDAFSWMTEEGIRCGYSPRMREIHKNMTPTENGGEDLVYNEPVATRGGTPSGNQVYLVGPYYGYDSDFTSQYKTEATRIAKTMGDTDGYTLYSGKSATVDKVAEAVSKGAVVIFDSHGSTDYESGYDCVTGATSSYLCLTSTTGLTSDDYADGALYYSSGVYINGATIANHMKSDSPGGILWMAICLGMATNTICDPLREKGVEVVCGYSQTVTFAGDYLFEDAFWDQMCEGKTVAESAAYMKNLWGNWDWSTKIAKYYGYSDGSSTITDARTSYRAFPVIVSDEDKHPGQRNKNVFYGADSLQTVKSTYTLFNIYSIQATTSNTSHGEVSVNGNVITAVPASGYLVQGYTLVSGSAVVTQNGNEFYVQAESDCTVQILFAPRQTVTVTFRGQEITRQTGYSGESMTLPTATAPEGYTFLGWVENKMSNATTTAPAYLTGSFAPTESMVLYALYSYREIDPSAADEYIKVTAMPEDWSGEYLIVYEGSNYIFNGSLTSFDTVANYKEVTITNNAISAQQGAEYSFTIAPVSGDYYSIRGSSGNYIGNNSNSNALTTSSTTLNNKITMGSDGTVNIRSSGGAYLRFNNNAGQYRFRYYKSSSYTSHKAVCLYKRTDGGTDYYTTQLPVACVHLRVENSTCADCGVALAAQVGKRYYEDLQTAIIEAEGMTVQLLSDGETVWSEKALRLDLNGYKLQSLMVSGGVFAWDSTATVTGEGAGKILQVNGAVVADHTVNGARYIALNNNGVYTFHRLEMKLDTVTLRTEETGLYYQGSVLCDATLAGAIRSHGIALSLVDMPDIDYREAHNRYTVNAGAPKETFASVMVSGILSENAHDNDARGKMAIYANAYLELEDGTVILSDNTSADTKEDAAFSGVAYSLYDMMTALDCIALDIPDAQYTVLYQFCENWLDPMKNWELTYLLG